MQLDGIINNKIIPIIGESSNIQESVYSGENVCRGTTSFANHEIHVAGDIGQAIKFFIYQHK